MKLIDRFGVVHESEEERKSALILIMRVVLD